MWYVMGAMRPQRLQGDRVWAEVTLHPQTQEAPTLVQLFES